MLIEAICQLLDFFFGTFGKDFDAAVGEIADPALKAELLGQISRRKAEADPLNYTGIENMGLNHIGKK